MHSTICACSSAGRAWRTASIPGGNRSVWLLSAKVSQRTPLATGQKEVMRFFHLASPFRVVEKADSKPDVLHHACFSPLQSLPPAAASAVIWHSSVTSCGAIRARNVLLQLTIHKLQLGSSIIASGNPVVINRIAPYEIGAFRESPLAVASSSRPREFLVESCRHRALRGAPGGPGASFTSHPTGPEAAPLVRSVRR